MNRSLTSLFAAFEALLVVAIGVGISLAPLTVLWGVQYGFAPDWTDSWRASVDIWLIGHGVDVVLTLDTATATGLGFPGAGDPFAITVAALGFALLTVLLGMRAGRRIAQTDFRLFGEAVSVGVFALLAFALTASAGHPLAQPAFVQGIVFPTLVFALGLAIGTLRTPRPGMDAAAKAIRAWISYWSVTTRDTIVTALRGGTAAAVTVVAAGSVVVASMIFASFAEIITLYEGLHAGALGGFVLTVAQIAFLPNLVMWGVSWLIGPGFAIGTGSSVSPLATSLGPIPAIPVFGALPAGDSAFGFVGVLVPVIAGFLAGALLRSRATSSTAHARFSALLTVVTGLGMGIVGGLLLGLLAAASSGSVGPGRLATVGPDPWQVGLWAALEIGVAAILGLFASAHLPRALTAVTDRIPGSARSAGPQSDEGRSEAGRSNDARSNDARSNGAGSSGARSDSAGSSASDSSKAGPGASTRPVAPPPSPFTAGTPRRPDPTH
jgi:hypothetical protein